MKTTAVLLLCILAISASAKTNNNSINLKATLTNLVNMQARAVDAVDAALDLLNSLKQQNIDAQNKHNEKNATDEATHGANIADLTYIADQNKASGDKATEHRKHVQEEIAITQEYLVWITNRRNEINRKREEFKEQRCFASLQFVKALKEHDEALEVIRWLREDIMGVISEHNEEEVDFSQITSSADKLSAYAHLFTMNQMKEFAQLTKVGPQDVNAETAEYDSRASDNERDNLELQRQTAGTEQRSIGNRVLDMVDKLEKHLEESMENLKQNEIRAAWDLVRWLQSTEVELVHLDEEQAAKTTYIDKLLIAIVGAKAREDKLWEIYFESAAALNTAIDTLNEVRAWYMQEKARRDEENALLDEVIRMFVERVQSIDQGMRTKVNDYSEDGVFNNSDLSRRTDAMYGKDYGKLSSNVSSESRA